MNVRAVCAVGVTTLAARKLVDVLEMIRAGLSSIPHHYLSITVHKSDFGRCCALSRHPSILTQSMAVRLQAALGHCFGTGAFAWSFCFSMRSISFCALRSSRR